MQTTRYQTKSILAIVALFVASSVMSQASTIDGFVSDKASGGALEGALVKIPELNLEAKTNRRGYFKFDGLDTGTYAVQVDYIGSTRKTTAVDVSAVGSETLDVELETKVYDLPGFTVTSYQSATARALNMQRSSENLKNIVASDQFGQFADTNAAEALNRLPGVSVERDQGEGRFVVIRGIDPNLNSVALDGVALASPDDSERATLLDTLPIEVLNTLEVTKAVTPDQPGDAIGGYINLRSPSAFDYDKRTARVSGAMLYSDLVDETGHRLNAFYADTFGEDEQWGFVLTAVDSERTFGSDNTEGDSYIIEDGVVLPEELQFREYDLVRSRTGVTANLEFQPSNESLFFFRTSFNVYEDTETRDRVNFEFEDGDNGFTGVTSSSFTHDNVVVKPEFKDRLEEQSIFVVSLGGEQTIEDWSVDYTLAFSEAEQDTPYDKEVLYESDGGTTATVNGFDQYIFNLGNATAGPDFSDPTIYEFDELTDGSQLVTETDISGKLNLKREFDGERLKYIKFGGLLRNKEKDNDAEADEIEPINGFASFVNPNVRNPYGSPIPRISANILNNANLDETTRERVLQDSVEEDYETTEDVFAAYFMGSFDLGEWNLIAGARVERTDFKTEGFDFDEETDTATRTSFSKDYTNFLPGVHLRKDVGENGVFRTSWTNTIARPNFAQSAPRITRKDPGEFEQGNPDLEPYEAMNWDASYQYYSEEHGVFGVAVFYKDIDNFIYEQEFTGAAADAVRPGADVVETFANGDSGDILGLELSYSKQFIELPGALSGLSLTSNLTFVDSEANAERPGDAGSVTTSFLKQSDLIGNISLAWEWDRYFIRLSSTYRDDYLDGLGKEANGIDDRYADDFLQFDFYSSVRVNEGLSVFAEVNNFTNEPFRAYFGGGSNRLSQFEEYGVSGAIGAKWSF